MRAINVFYLIVFGVGSATFANAGKDKKTTSENPIKLPVILSLTTKEYIDGTGCWAKIYDGYDFKGRALTLVGNQALPNLEFAPLGTDWEGTIDSVETGSNAKLILFKDENYKDKKRELKPGERIANLHKTVFSEGVESVRLECTRTSGTAAR